MAITTLNPATEEILASFAALTGTEIEEKLELAAEASRQFRYASFSERGRILLRVAGILEGEQDRFSRLITTEMGKPIRSAVREIEKSVKLCRYYATEAEHLLADEEISSEAHSSFIRCEPLGALLVVTPWNFPFWQVIRVAAPAIMAGNVVLVKHAPNVPQCALELERIFRKAGAAKSVFQVLLIESSQVASLIADERVAAVWLTGSDRAGSAVGAQAGAQIKKSVLELGGSDPFIVMPSADLDKAVSTAVKARMLNSGQSCVAAKRFIIAEGIYEEFQRRFVDQMKCLTLGDPFDETTEVGPLATREGLIRLEAQVNALVAAGARVLLGGHRLDRRGFFYAPTVLADIDRSNSTYREEIFGPVALLFRARDLVDAIRLANDTPFGLGASIWTNDEAESVCAVQEIQAGTVVVNGIVASDVRFPFGGVKRSGYGRELGAHGLREFVNLKTIRIQHWNIEPQMNADDADRKSFLSA